MEGPQGRRMYWWGVTELAVSWVVRCLSTLGSELSAARGRDVRADTASYGPREWWHALSTSGAGSP
jgi:hypothetical protein